jgi:hypothetical protein
MMKIQKFLCLLSVSVCNISFAYMTTPQDVEILFSTTPSHISTNGYIYKPYAAGCFQSGGENIGYYTTQANQPVSLVVEENSIFCVVASGYYNSYQAPYGPYKASDGCHFYFNINGTIASEQGCTKVATTDIQVINADRWGFDVGLFYANADGQCGKAHPPKEHLTRIPEYTEGLVPLYHDESIAETTICLYLETYLPNHHAIHGPFQKIEEAAFIIYNTKEVGQSQ